MQTKDIKVGEVYAYRNSKYSNHSPVRILEIAKRRPERRYGYGRGAETTLVHVARLSADLTPLHYAYERKDGAVEVTEWVRPQTIKQTWESYKDANAAAKIARAEYEARQAQEELERVRQLASVNEQLSAAKLETVNEYSVDRYGYVKISLSDLEAIVNRLDPRLFTEVSA